MVQTKVLLIFMVALVAHTVQSQSCNTTNVTADDPLEICFSVFKDEDDKWHFEEITEEEEKEAEISDWVIEMEDSDLDQCNRTHCRLVTTVLSQCISKNHSKQDQTDGYKLYDNLGPYKLHNEFANWTQAKTICESENAHLVVVNSIEEVAVMEEISADSEGLLVLAGFSDQEEHGKWVDIFGNPVLGFWYPGEPNNDQNKEHCGSIFTNGYLNDFPCFEKTSFICEKTQAK